MFPLGDHIPILDHGQGSCHSGRRVLRHKRRIRRTGRGRDCRSYDLLLVLPALRRSRGRQPAGRHAKINAERGDSEIQRGRTGRTTGWTGRSGGTTHRRGTTTHLRRRGRENRPPQNFFVPSRLPHLTFDEGANAKCGRRFFAPHRRPDIMISRRIFGATSHGSGRTNAGHAKHDCSKLRNCTNSFRKAGLKNVGRSRVLEFFIFEGNRGKLTDKICRSALEDIIIVCVTGEHLLPRGSVARCPKSREGTSSLLTPPLLLPTSHPLVAFCLCERRQG